MAKSKSIAASKATSEADAKRAIAKAKREAVRRSREQNPPSTKTHLTETEVFTTTGIGIRQLRNMRARGDGPPFNKTSGEIGKRGGRVVYPFVPLLAWIASRPGGGERGSRV